MIKEFDVKYEVKLENNNLDILCLRVHFVAEYKEETFFNYTCKKKHKHTIDILKSWNFKEREYFLMAVQSIEKKNIIFEIKDYLKKHFDVYEYSDVEKHVLELNRENKVKITF